MTDELLSIDEVAFAPLFPNPAPTDAVGELLWVEVSDLRIDPRYQRPIGARGEKNIKQVIENFSWNLFSPLVVARRPGGLFAVIDGQHRAIAARTHGGIEKVPALVIAGGPDAEAQAFAVINGAVTAISPTQIWHARVVAGDVAAIRLSRVLTKLGVTVLRSPKNDMLPGETLAVDAREKSFKTAGPAAFELALRTIVETGSGNPGYLRAPLIKATSSVLAANGAWRADPDGVLRAIKTVGIKYLNERAERRRLDEKITFHAAYSRELETLFLKEIRI